MTAKNFRSNGEILQPSVCTGTDNYLLNGNLPNIIDRFRISRQMRKGHYRFQRRQVDRNRAGILCIGIRRYRLIRLFNPALNILLRSRVKRKNAIFPSRFNRHISNGKAIRHGKLCHSCPTEL